MRATLFGIAALSSILSYALAQNATSLPFQTLHRFSNGTWIENMAIRENGQILMTDLTGSRVYLVDPTQPQLAPVIHQFAANTTLTGITELAPDIFYTQSIIGINPYADQLKPNTSVMWEIDMRRYDQTRNATVQQIATLPEIGFPNGLCQLPQKNDTLLIADSQDGLIWELNVQSGQYKVYLDDPSLKPVATAELQLGVNGVQVFGSALYYTNTNQGLIGTVSIASNGKPTGPPRVLTNSVPGADDFTVDSSGDIWAMWNAGNSLYRVSPDGTVKTFAPQAPSNGFLGPTRASFRRGRSYNHTLYAVTDGLEFSSNGTLLSDRGGVFAFDLSSVL